MSKKVAFITGATVGLGQVLTQVFIVDGYQIILSSLVAARLKAIIDTPNHQAIFPAKAGIDGLVCGASASYASNNIRVNAVAPGLLNMPAAGNLIARNASRELTAQYPMKGLGNAPDLARLMACLSLEQTSRVTGQAWSIEGEFSSIRPIVK